MSSKTPATAVVILLLTLVASMMLSARVAQWRMTQVIQSPSSHHIVRAGFNKFLSQIAWIRLIQLRGGMDQVTEKNAATLAKKYDYLTNLDPMFVTAYESGALDIAWENPEESLRLLNKAMEVGQIKNWKIPFIAGFIAKTRLQDSERAIKYIELAVAAPESPSYVQRFLIYLKSELYPNDPSKILSFWVDYFNGGVDKMGGLGQNAENMHGTDSDRKFALNQISRISSEIIADSQKKLEVETDSEKKKILQARMTRTQKVVSQIYSGSHICKWCFRPYNAGDQFCPYDGKPLEIYGACPKDQAVVRGSFCHKCGAKVN